MQTLFTIVVICLWGSWLAGQNLLQNPSFEKIDPNGLPEGWTRIFNPRLSGPFAIVADAQDGVRAVCMETEEWNYQRPQHLSQRVSLPAGAALCRLSAFAKGRGLVSLSVQFFKDGKPLEMHVVDIGCGPEQVPVEIKKDFALEQCFAPYQILCQVPSDADAALVKLGNTAGLLDRYNTWGRCIIDNACFMAGSRREVEAGAIVCRKSSLPIHSLGKWKNVAPMARIRTEPPSLDARALADGDIKTAATYYLGAERGGILRFVFPRPLPIRAVRLHLNGQADSYTVRGDGHGDGVFKTLLVRTEGMEGLAGWKTHSLAGDAFAAIQVQALAGPEGLWGFRQTGSYVTEVEILTDADAVQDAELKDWRSNCYETAPAGGVPEIDVQSCDFSPGKSPAKFHKIVCADLWMWGIDYNKNTKKGTWTKDKIQACPTFQRSAKIAHAMGLDTIFIDLTNSTCWDLMPWPSKVCNGIEDNILKGLIEALHAEGFRVVTETLHNFTPFETIKWHYPCEETSRYPAMKQYPSILYGNHVRDNWLKVYEEQIAAGADGVCLGSDEFYYRGHFLRTLPADDAQRKHYEAVHKRPVPPKESDTLDYRWWVNDTQEGLADLFTYWNRQLKRKHPNLYTCSVFMQPVQRSNLYGECTPFDLIGQRASMDEIGGDYMDPWGIKMLVAANGWRKVSQLFWGWHPASDHPINLYAKPLWMLMYGGGSANYWRFYQLQESGHWRSVKKGFDMVSDLEALGAWEARPAHDIAVLSSRAAWDWWQVKAYYGALQGPGEDRAIHAMRGWYTDQLINEKLLIRNGYSYDWYFLDSPSHLQQLDGYKVLLLPFAYSVSDAAVKAIRGAATKGAKVILVNMLGETDEWGQSRSTPAFKDLVQGGQAVLLTEDAMDSGADDRFAQKVLGLIDAALGDKQAFKAQLYGKRIDATLLANGAKGKFVFLINWEEKPATVDLSLDVPEGNYRLLMRDDEQWNRVALGGKDLFTKAMLYKFRRVVPAQKAEVYYVVPVEKPSGVH
jgi:hypothetical protein